MSFHAFPFGLLNRCAVATALVTVCAATVAQDVASPPWVKDPGIKAYREGYQKGAQHKAFAIAESGQFGWADKRESTGKAAQTALLNCVRQAPKSRCYLFSVDGNVVLDFYPIAASDSVAVVARMRAPRQSAIAEETRDTGLAPTYDPKVGRLKGPTPPTSPYALNVTTGALADLLSAKEPPLVLDVTEMAESYKKNALPGAIWVSGAGIHDEKFNQQTDRYLTRVMGQITSEKEKPVIVYCADWECWEAYNAMQRLYINGYRKLYWYRGGLAAWTKAGLPVVEVPLSAQVAQVK